MSANGEKESALRVLEEYFRGDERALEMIRFLREREGTNIPDRRNGVEPPPLPSGERFPLPREVAGREGFFALFSDGACRGNPGPGAWGAMGQNGEGEVIFESSGVDFSTTNNCMELEGAIKALEELERYAKEGGIPLKRVFLFSDSKYVVDGITRWVRGWKARDWRKVDKSPVMNGELWRSLDAVKNRFRHLEFRWVRGHAGHPQNEHVDKLANKALDESMHSL